MNRTAVKIAYLGEHFFGSQIQPGFRTVGGDVLADLVTITRMPEDEIDLKFASRTDKGVNSLGNVAVFNSSIDDPDILLKALNAVSKDIFYRSAAFVNADFNPRHADLRKYRYVLRSDGMDLQTVRICAELFTGEHDFKRFCKPDGKPTIALLNSVDVRKEGDLIVLDFTARYFLWNMVRRIVAAIASAGMGDSSLSDVEDALNGKDISFGIARPDALTLTDVFYKDVEFITPSGDMFDRRVEEEMYREKLKNLFYASL
jgi:tRNA pseudouridine38-40 synthase